MNVGKLSSGGGRAHSVDQDEPRVKPGRIPGGTPCHADFGQNNGLRFAQEPFFGPRFDLR